MKLHFLRNPLHEPYTILQYLFENDLFSTFPNTVISLRILLTLPISVASGERLFSKLKIIKNYLRSTMVQHSLNNLSIIAIEHEILDNLDMKHIITEFSNMKARKFQFV